jgi:hypothetical protein
MTMKTFADLGLISGMPVAIGGGLALSGAVTTGVAWLASQALVEDFLVSAMLAQISVGLPNELPGRPNVSATNYVVDWDAGTLNYTLKVYGER